MQLADGIAGTENNLAFLVNDVAGSFRKLIQGCWREAE